MLLSPRSRKVDTGQYAVCIHCKVAMKPSQASSKNPPKFAITNGFAIGSFPARILFTSPSQEGEFRTVDVQKDVNKVMKALVAPV